MVDCSQMLGVHYDPVVVMDFSEHVLLWTAIFRRRTLVVINMLLRGVSSRVLLRGVSSRVLLRGVSSRVLLRGVSSRVLLRGVFSRVLLRSVSSRVLLRSVCMNRTYVCRSDVRMCVSAT